jgi:hypothetical protein
MTLLEVIIILVAAFGGVVAFAEYLYRAAPRGLEHIGRQGHAWFDRADDRPISERPNEDDRDAPLPRRRLRGRPE